MYSLTTWFFLLFAKPARLLPLCVFASFLSIFVTAIRSFCTCVPSVSIVRSACLYVPHVHASVCQMCRKATHTMTRSEGSGKSQDGTDTTAHHTVRAIRVNLGYGALRNLLLTRCAAQRPSSLQWSGSCISTVDEQMLMGESATRHHRT